MSSQEDGGLVVVGASCPKEAVDARGIFARVPAHSVGNTLLFPEATMMISTRQDEGSSSSSSQAAVVVVVVTRCRLQATRQDTSTEAGLPLNPPSLTFSQYMRC